MENNEEIKESKERVKVIVNVLKQSILLQKLMNRTVDGELIENLVASLEAVEDFSKDEEFNKMIEGAIGFLRQKKLEEAMKELTEAIIR